MNTAQLFSCSVSQIAFAICANWTNKVCPTIWWEQNFHIYILYDDKHNVRQNDKIKKQQQYRTYIDWSLSFWTESEHEKQSLQ